MNKEMTLFARYKKFINDTWEAGFTMYTAKELNYRVGDFESKTSWKRWSNNPYYSTRSYQTALKQLGCITMIKRGLWKINGPIPEWFGSFHVSALSNHGAHQELENSSTYWKSLPAAHKVNPWKVNPFVQNTAATATESDIEVAHSEDAWYEISLLPDLMTNFRVQINILSDYNKDEAEHEIFCTRFVIGENETIPEDVARGIISACGRDYDVVMSNARGKAYENAEFTVATLQEGLKSISKEEPIAKTYSQDEVQQLLTKYSKGMLADLKSALADAIYAEDLLKDHIDLKWDSYNHSIDIIPDEASATSRINNILENRIETMLRDTLIDHKLC